MPKQLNSNYHKALWYQDSQDAIKRTYGDYANLFSAFLVATSPNCMLNTNVTLARKAWNYWYASKPFPREAFIKSAYSCLNTFINTQRFFGRKTHAFWLALQGNQNAIVIDVWIMRHFGYTNKVPTKRQYEAISVIIAYEAGGQGFTPCQWQAVLWCNERQDCTTYADYLRQEVLL